MGKNEFWRHRSSSHFDGSDTLVSGPSLFPDSSQTSVLSYRFGEVVLLGSSFHSNGENNDCCSVLSTTFEQAAHGKYLSSGASSL